MRGKAEDEAVLFGVPAVVYDGFLQRGVYKWMKRSALVCRVFSSFNRRNPSV
jgi:hypothetical protein